MEFVGSHPFGEGQCNDLSSGLFEFRHVNHNRYSGTVESDFLGLAGVSGTEARHNRQRLFISPSTKFSYNPISPGLQRPCPKSQYGHAPAPSQKNERSLQDAGAGAKIGVR